jgi:galactokinase
VVASDLNDEQNWLAGQWSASYPRWTAYVAGVIELLAQRGARIDGAHVAIASDVPLGAGLSSSAALTVATTLALALMSGEPLDTREVVDLCREAEHRFAGVPCGLLDPTASLCCTADTALLIDCRSRRLTHVPLILRDHALLAIHSGVRHSLGDGAYAQRQRECGEAVAYFRRRLPATVALRDISLAQVRQHASQMPPVVAARAIHVAGENERTLAGVQCLKRGDMRGFGRLMFESHASLRDNYEVSCRELDAIVAALAACPGVCGARMTGAGFGGCVVALVERHALQSAKAAVRAIAGMAESSIYEVTPSAGAAVSE